MPVLQLTNVRKTYRQGFSGHPVEAVSNISCSIDTGELVGFVGPNGAGKTTTIKMIMGLMRPTAGAISVLGERAGDAKARARVGFVTEQPYFYDHLTVRETVLFVGRLRGLDKGTDAAEAGRVLDLVGLAEAGGNKVRALSKGMQQRLNLAQALVGDPELFILDEPMSGMDPPGRTLFRRLFRELHGRGKTIFFSTHILEDIEALCERVVVFSRGKTTYDGPVQSLLSQGLLGSDLTVPELTDAELRARLRQAGAELFDASPGETVIRAPGDADLAALQKLLSEHGVFCRAITPRMQSLETLLYSGSSAGSALPPLISGSGGRGGVRSTQ